MVTKKEILEDVKKTAENTEGYLSLKKYREKGNLGNRIFNKFDKWNEIKKELGLPTVKKTIGNQLDKIKEMVEQEKSPEEIAEELGTTKHYLNTVMKKKLGITKRNIVNPSYNKVSGNKRIQFSFIADILKDAGLENYKELDNIYYDVETDSENKQIIITFKDSLYRQPDD